MTQYSSIPHSEFRTTNRESRKKTIYRWLRERTSSVDYGFKYNGHPVHCNPNEKVLAAFNGGRWLSRMTNGKFNDHFSGNKTHYFTGQSNSQFPETLLNIDIDCHKRGTLAGAIAFAGFLKEHHFPGLYFEVSTNGNGVHAYVVVEKGELGSAFLNGLFRRFEQHLRQILSTTNFDVEDVEIKGTCPVFVWGDRRGQPQNYTSGTLAKFPRDSHRFEELKNTTRLSYLDLLKLPTIETNHPANTAVFMLNCNPRVSAGSISGKVIGENDIAQLEGHYLKVAEILMETHVLKTTGRTVATTEDLAIFLMLLQFFTTHMNRDGSLPYSRFKGMWDAVFAAGDINRSFESKRFATIRNYLSSLGLIEWTDENYTLGTIGSDGSRHKGKAARWKASELLMTLLNWQNSENQQEMSGVGADAEERREEETSFAVTRIRNIVTSLPRQPRNDITKPRLFDKLTDSWLVAPDELVPFIQTFEDSLFLAV